MRTNSPKLWKAKLPIPDKSGHKYDRGHALIIGAETLTGATGLAAISCNRIGAGLVTVFASANSDLYRAILPFDIMVRSTLPDDLSKFSALLAGPGGITERQRDIVEKFPVDTKRILDANAIPLNSDFHHPGAITVLTPHEGEFTRAFPKLDGSKENRALEAAKLSNAIIVLKGMPTVLAAPNGRLVVNDHASPWLAKAGTGDVLAGMITGLIAQGMDEFDAACAACWMHGEAGLRLGPGLVASDIEQELAKILQELI